MKDFGKARAKVLIKDTLPNIEDNQYVEGRDFVASDDGAWLSSKSATDLKTYNMERINIGNEQKYQDSLGSIFGAIFPKKSYWQIPNFMTGHTVPSGILPKQRAEWKVPEDPLGSVEKVSELGESSEAYWNPIRLYLSSEHEDQAWHTGPDYPVEYSGPRWGTVFIDKEGVVDENMVNSKIAGAVPAGTAEGDDDKTVFDRKSTAVKQETSGSTYWGVECGASIDTMIPFYITVDRERFSGGDKSTAIVIRIIDSADGFYTGTETTSESFDLVISENKGVELIDYGNIITLTDDDGESFMPTTVSLDFGNDIALEKHLRIGFLPVLGRLAVFINDVPNVYQRSRVDDDNTGSSFDFKAIEFKAEKIQVWGTNCQARVSLSAMSFFSGHMQLPIGPAQDENGNYNLNWEDIGIGMPNNLSSDEEGSSAECCCQKIFKDGAALSFPDDIDEEYGEKCANPMGKVAIVLSKSKKEDAKYLKLAMIGTHLKWKWGDTVEATENHESGSITDISVPWGGPPFLFRLRGTKTEVANGTGGGPTPPTPPTSGGSSTEDVSEDVISITRRFEESTENSLVQQTAEIVLYNDGGAHADLLKKGKGVQIWMGWEDVGGGEPTRKVFTGISLGGQRTEVAGREAISLHCEDYMRILEDTRILNSPYYDGMDAFDVIFDLAERAGITAIDDTPANDDERYFLPAGYSFNNPKAKFPKKTSVKEAISQISQAATCVVYFDENGEFHWEALQGGLLLDNGDIEVVDDGKYYRDPASAESEGWNIILDEFQADYLVGEAINKLYVWSIDRASGQFISHPEPEAEDSENVLPYKKIGFIDQPALGSIAAVRTQASRLAKRLYATPTKVNFSTVTKAKITPLSFITVDDTLFRVNNFSETLDASNNSFTATITGEWYGPLKEV